MSQRPRSSTADPETGPFILITATWRDLRGGPIWKTQISGPDNTQTRAQTHALLLDYFAGYEIGYPPQWQFQFRPHHQRPLPYARTLELLRLRPGATAERPFLFTPEDAALLSAAVLHDLIDRDSCFQDVAQGAYPVTPVHPDRPNSGPAALQSYSLRTTAAQDELTGPPLELTGPWGRWAAGWSLGPHPLTPRTHSGAGIIRPVSSGSAARPAGPGRAAKK